MKHRGWGYVFLIL